MKGRGGCMGCTRRIQRSKLSGRKNWKEAGLGRVNGRRKDHGFGLGMI